VKKTQPAAPKLRFCGCDDEPLPSKPGMPVYVKAPGVMTLSKSEASIPEPIGFIDSKHRVQFNETAEQALKMTA
jgi:hypothetical protein